MSHHKRYAEADATTESLSLIAAKLEVMDARQQADSKALRSDMAVLNENQIHTNRALDAIMAHLGIPKPGKGP